jgi:excisionase family DNA binding protein
MTYNKNKREGAFLMTDQSYSTYQVAERLGLSVRRVQALVSIGLLKANKHGRDWVISEEEVERFKKQERMAGRPRRTMLKEEIQFLDQPSEVYLQVVEIIKTLADKEGLGTANRAFADAVSKLIQKEVMI